MSTRQLTQLLSSLPTYSLTGPVDSTITDITPNLEDVRAGSLYIAYQGMTFDRHQNVKPALEKGAVAVVIEKAPAEPLPDGATVVQVPDSREAWGYLAAAWHDHPSRKLCLIGITGTDGKTSTTNLIYAILKGAGRRTGMISTVNAVIGDQALDTGFHVTTPDAPDIQRYLAQMVEAQTEICLLETTSHGLAYHRVTGCDYDLAVVTNITHEHLNHHQNSLEAYRLAKARLFDMAGQAAILNTDDWSYHFLQERIGRRIPIIRYGLAPEADVRAERIELRPDATVFQVTLNGRRYQIESPLVGAFNVSNVLAALATTVVGLGITPEIAIDALKQFKGVPGRMERIDMGQPFTAIVDFAHAPNALQRALETVRTLTTGRIIAVFGCAGQRDVEKRTMMGYIAANLADITIITAEDPRTEDLAAIIDVTAQAMLSKGALEGPPFDQTPAFTRILDRGQAIYYATQLARPGDIVIALGKGHEQSMCFGTIEYPWDDREAMRAALRGQPLRTLPTA